MKKRLLGILLSLAMVVTMMPVLGLSLTAYADVTHYNLWVAGIEITSVKTVVNSDDNPDIIGTATYNPSTRTLTLNGFNNGGLGIENSAIYYNNRFNDLKIELVGENVVSGGEHGICSTETVDIEISGSGSLTASGNSGSGISASRYLTKNGSGSLTASSKSGSGINGGWGVTINGGTLIVRAAQNGVGGEGVNIFNAPVDITSSTGAAISAPNGLNIENSSVTLDGNGAISRAGLDSCNITITNSIVDAKGNNGKGIYNNLSGRISIIDGSNVTATGNSCGIDAESGNIEISEDSTVTAAGAEKGIKGTVKNALAGTGWSNKEGTEGWTPIEINADPGQDLSAHKKVQFPGVPKPAPTPTPTPTPTPAANPLTVTTTAKTSARSMTVKWTWNNVPGAKSYKVSYHKVGSKKWTTKTTKKTKYVVKGHKMKGLYEYKVAAVTASGDVWSNTSCRYFKGVKTKAKAGKAAGTVKASWKKDKGATGYQVKLATNKKLNGAQVVNVSANQKSYTFSGLKSGKKYYVSVRPLKDHNGVTYQGIRYKALKVKAGISSLCRPCLFHYLNPVMFY